MDKSDSRARAGIGSGTGSGAALSRVGTTVFQKGTAPLKTHEHVMAAAASGTLLGASLLGARFPRLIAWPLVAVGAFLGGLASCARPSRRSPTVSRTGLQDRPESGAT